MSTNTGLIARLREGQTYDFSTGLLNDMSCPMDDAADAIEKLQAEVDRLSAAGVSHCGHRPPCAECSKYAASIPQQPVESPSVPTLDQIRAAIEDNLTCMYACTRVWEAWHVGTMSQEDFIHASETEFAEDTANAIHALFAAAPQPKEQQ